MSYFKRNLQHQHIARQVTLIPEPSASKPAGGGGGGGGGGGEGGGGGGGGGGNHQSSSSPITTPKPTPPTSTSKSTKPTQTTKKQENEGTETDTDTETSTSSESSSSASKSESTSLSSKTTITPMNTFLNTGLNTNTFIPVTPTVTSDIDIPSVSPSSAGSNSSSTGAINTGAIIGGIAGGLAGLALFGIIISFILRRYRSRRRAQEFDSSQFRGSAMVMDSDDPRPISLFGGRFGGVAPSIRSSVGPGMAGHGAYQAGYSDNTPTQPDMQYHDYQSTPTTATALQPRQQYTYGENYDNAASRDDDLTHGAYSEQPQPQAVYNLEAYGDYEAYTSSGVSYPAATHQGRHAKHDDDPYGGI